MTAGDKAQVVILQHSIRRYREAFFEQLRTRLAELDISLRLVVSDHPAYLAPGPHQAVIPWAEVRIGRRFWFRDLELLWQPVLRETRNAQLVVTEQAAHLLVNYALVARQVLGGPPVAFWGHGRNFLTGAARPSLPERLKQRMSRRVHWWFAYNDLSADVVAGMGFPPEHITSVRNATDTRRLAAAVAAVTERERSTLRRELGLTGDNIAVFAGTLGAVKRFDHLFAAADRIRAQIPDFELVITGDGKEKARVSTWAAARSWASYGGARFEEDLAPLLAQAKVMLVPSWAGLVITDSFAAGVPPVASASCPHPPEISYVRDGVNGLLVEDHGEPTRYADAVVALLRDEERRSALVHGCEAARREYTVEHMVERFSDGIRRALQHSRTGASR